MVVAHSITRRGGNLYFSSHHPRTNAQTQPATQRLMLKSKCKLVLQLSDLHIGSTVGIWPKGFVCNEGYPIGQNKFQEWLWECWQDMEKWVDSVVGGDDFEIVFNGDLVEGIHHRTLQVMSPDVGDQTAAVDHVVGKLCAKAARVHLIKGTECHTRGDEIRLGKALGATVDPMTGQSAWDVLDLEVNGTLYNFAHHISATSRSYLEASAHSMALGALSHSRARTGKRVPLVVARAHRHRHGVWNDGNQISAICGAWQGLTRHGYKVVPDAVPQPSAIIYDSRTTEKGDLPLVHQRVYTAR